MVDLLHEPEEPLINTLPDRPSACVSQRDDPDDGIRRDRFEHNRNRRVRLVAANMLFIHGGETGSLRRLLRDEGHRNRDHGAEPGRDPKKPAPMQRRHGPQTEENEAGQQRGPKRVDEKTAGIDHETKNAGETAPLDFGKPGGVDFYHAGSAERLQVTVDSADEQKPRKHSGERGEPEKEIHRHGAGSADEHGAFAANAIGEQTVEDLPAGVSKERGGDDRAHLPLVETELVADGFVRDREVVATGVKRGVKEANEGPVQPAPGTEPLRMGNTWSDHAMRSMWLGSR